MAKHASPIAVVGVSTLFPGSVDSAGFWKDILSGKDRITDVPASHWLVEDYYDADPSAPDKTYAKRGAFLGDVDFDPMAWGIPPSTVPSTDTCQLLALIVAQRVLDDAARGQFSYADRERMSVILGVTSAQELLGAMVSRLQRPIWTKSLRDMGMPEDEVQEACKRIESHYTEWQESTFPGVLGNVVAGRIANKLNLGGTNCVTDAACASTFSALSMAVNELHMGQSDVVICGGADTMNDIFMYLCFSKTPALSKTGDCRPFSDDADGTMLGEGFAMVALKRLEDAERDGDRVYAVIRGVGSGSDGAGTAVYAPVAKGQARAIRRAYEVAGYGPETVGLVEAHGTGTIAGDAAELEGLKMVFEESGRAERPWCALGSVKSQIGHTKAAAGAAGLVKAIFALQHKALPPTIKVRKPSPKMGLVNSPFYLSTRARPWISDGAHPRRASVSSFGFGGSNFHIALEEYTGSGAPALKRRATESELFVVTGDSPAAVASAARAMAKDATLAGAFEFFARDSQRAYRADAPCRLAVIASDGEELAAKLASAATSVDKGEAFASPDGTAFGVGAPEGSVAFLFPGQGSQYVDMSAGLAMTWDAARAPWDLAARLPAFGDEKLHDVVFPKPSFDEGAKEAQDTKLTATEWAQPGIGAASLSLLHLMRELGVTPSAVAGHSFGEVIALHAAGVISEEDALKVARERGQRMADAAKSTAGAMVAVVASADELRERLAAWGAEVAGVVLANHNHPTQVVLSGPTDAIAKVEAKLAEAKLRSTRLSVATAFHSSVVSASTVPFAAFLADVPVSAPTIPVYGNTHAAPYSSDAAEIRATLANQLAMPVRFVEQIEAMYAAGARTFVEVGPGSVLSGLVGRILKGRPHRAVALDRAGKDAVGSLWRGLGQLVAAGVPMKLDALFAGFESFEDPRTAKKPKLVLKLNGSNYGKPYPPKEGATVLPKPNPKREPLVVREVVKEVVTEVVEVPVEVVREVVREVPVAGAAPATTALAAQAPSATPAIASPAIASDAWAQALLTVQGQAAETHAVYARSMAETHTAFLHAQQASLAALAAFASSPSAHVGVLAPAAPALAAPSPAVVAPVVAAPVAPAVVAPVAPAVVAPVAPAVVAPAAPAVVAPVAASAPAASAPTGSPAPSGVSVDLQALMLRIVAEKTGYPLEMLELSMDLEADLGVDSIKRVEILAAMREKAPGLPEVDPAELGKLRTLQEIVDRMGAAMPAPVGTPSASVPSTASVDLQALMLRIVAEKTGYPNEMLELSMDLEADLGVDSIKRVEILAAMREQAPGLPEVDPAELGKLRTLQEIVDRMGAALPLSTSSAPSSASASTSSAELQALMLRIVADKTGYPADMLELSMDLEADLGVDSIKRVEILAAMREQAPGLPEIDPAELGKLRTLQEIVDRMGAAMPTGAAVATPSAPSAVSVDLQALMLRIVADKTGYPADMLELSMDLEADLGVDSIKRVEILAAMREQAPELPEVDPAELGKLRTLQEIVDRMGASLPASSQASSPAASPVVASATSAAVASTSSAVELQALMLRIVADKTGYPADMLELSMDLEADLGVDSIKRVEILAAMREQAPNLPEVDPAELGKLRTLQEIVDRMGTSAPSTKTDATAPTTEATTEAKSDSKAARYALRLAPAPASGFALPHLLTCRRLVVTDDGEGVAAALVHELARIGRAAEVVTEVPSDADGVLFLDGLASVATIDDALAVSRRAFLAAKAVAAHLTEHEGVFVTVQDTGGDFGLGGGARAWLGGLPGLVKSAALEWPKAGLRAIDLERAGRSAEELAKALFAELLHGGAPTVDGASGGGREVALSADGTRRTLQSYAADVVVGAQRIGADDVVLASGGARGVTAATLIRLAQATRCKLVLVGRTALVDEPAATRGATTDAQIKAALLADAKARGVRITPAELGSQSASLLATREVRGTLAAIEAAGGKARYVAADVQDQAALDAALAEVRASWGPITAIVHGAGVLADRFIADKTVEQFDRVFDVKVRGLRALLEATKRDEVRVLVTFSSVAGRCGNRGQSDYAMANETLNKVANQWAKSASGRPLFARSFGWGPWEGGMVTPALEQHFRAMGVPLIPLDVGAQMLVDELADTSGSVELVLGGEPKPDALAPTAGAKDRRFEVLVDRASFPMIDAHRVKGQAVLPAALALELFARAAQATRPELVLTSCEELRVLKGVVLEGYEGAGDRLGVDVKQISNGDGVRLALQLLDAHGRPRYSAQATLGRHAVAADVAPSVPEGLASFERTVYDGVALFHGDAFRVIEDVPKVGEGGALATLVGGAARAWPSGAWETDPALVDGALQLALLWTTFDEGGAALPTSIRKVRRFQSGFASGPVRAVLVGQERRAERTLSDVVLIDAQGATVAELQGVEMHVLPGSRERGASRAESV